jgi:hypothetical protein
MLAALRGRFATALAAVLVVVGSSLPDGSALGADFALSADECANLKVLIDDAVFDFENRQGAQIQNPQAQESKFASKLIRYEVTGSTAPFKGCQLLAMSTQPVSTDRSLSCDLIKRDFRSETYRMSAEFSQGMLDMVTQMTDSISACLRAAPAKRAWPSTLCGDACTRHSYQWRLQLVPPKLDVIVKIDADIPHADAVVGRLKNEFEMDASIVRRGP